MACQSLPELPDDIWAKVLDFLQPEVPSKDSWSLAYKAEQTASDIHTFQALQQVCTQFRKVFLGTPQCQALLCLPMSFSRSSWDSLLTWIDRHKAKVQGLCALNAQATSAVLAPAVHLSQCPSDRSNRKSNRVECVLGLHRSYSRRERSNVTDYGVDCLLASFTSLTSCQLNVSAFTYNRPLDLVLLRDLPHLQQLNLQGCDQTADHGDGVCFNLDALQHLTKLVVLEARVSASADCAFVTKLRCLEVENGQLRGMHSAGLTACQQLCQLQCMNAIIGADMNSLATNHISTHIPDGLSLLTQLSHLEMHVRSSYKAPRRHLVLSWLPNLTNLRKLKFECAYPFMLPVGTSELTQLEDLRLYCGSDTLGSRFRVDLNWAALCRLKQLSLRGSSCLVDHNLQGLAEIKTLRDVYFDVDTSSVRCTEVFVALRRAFENRDSIVNVHWAGVDFAAGFFEQIE